MQFPADFPITRKWPPRHPDRIQLYSINSPNGVKASIMLEETGLPYEPHLVRLDQPMPRGRRRNALRDAAVAGFPGGQHQSHFRPGGLLS